MTRLKIKFSVIPILGSYGYDDLRWLLLLLPVWWLLGIEQFVWPVLLLWSLIKIVVRKRFKIAITPLAVAFSLFLISQLFSAVFISASIRYISFIRTFSTYLSVLLLVLILKNSDLSDEQSEKLIDAVLLSIGITGLLGVLAELGIWRPQINSLISYILPGGIKNTSYGSVIAFKSLGHASWFSGLGNYYRLSGLFLYPTLYGSALAFVTPVAFYRLGYPSRTFSKARSLTLIAVLLFNLIYTTGRTAILSLLLGGVLFLWFFAKRKIQFRVSLALLAGLVLMVFILVSIAHPAVFKGLEDIVGSFLYARGEGTVVSRFSIYQHTLEDLIRRPLWGWGTERDIEGIKIPLGSHSFYLALLYRFGIIGFGIYLFIIAKTWFTVAGKRQLPERPGVHEFNGYVQWVIVTGLLDGLFTVPLLDMNTLMFFWIPVILALTRTSADKIDASPSHH